LRGKARGPLAVLFGIVAFAVPATAAAAAECSNEAVRTGASAGLPDCRALELVSPSDKNGYDVESNGIRAAAAGGAVVFDSLGAFAGNASAPFFSHFLSGRDAAAQTWATKGVSPPVNPFALITSPGFFDWSPDLARTVVQGTPHTPLTADAAEAPRSLYLRDNGSDAYSLLSLGLSSEPAPVYGGSSNDLSHVVFGDSLPLTPDAPEAAPNNVYEHVGGKLRLVGIEPGGEPFPSGVELGAGEAFNSARNAVSDDGSRIFFSTVPSEEFPFERIFARLDGATTVEVSASKRTDPDPAGPQRAEYITASPDGSTVLFASQSELTDDANTGESDSGNDLYGFDVDGETLTDLSADPNDPNGAEVLGVVGIGDDGAWVYFVAKGRLEAGKGVAGEPNLYVWHAGEAKFIATLSPADELDWSKDTVFQTPQISSRVAADGTEAVVTTVSQQPGFDNVDPQTGQPHSEVYRFDADATPAFACVSCNPEAAAATGDATITPPPGEAFGSSGEYLSRALGAADGSVYFNSTEALDPGDANGVGDVYRWRAAKVDLLSSGTAPAPAFFGDADLSGENVYLTTRGQLAAQDRDDLVDVYDARVDGGFPAEAPPPSCGGALCRGPGSQPAAASDPGSSSFVGPGDAKPVHRRHHRRKRQHRRHHKQRHFAQAKRTSRG
jgi:hypothetical protein